MAALRAPACRTRDADAADWFVAPARRPARPPPPPRRDDEAEVDPALSRACSPSGSSCPPRRRWPRTPRSARAAPRSRARPSCSAPRARSSASHRGGRGARRRPPLRRRARPRLVPRAARRAARDLPPDVRRRAGRRLGASAAARVDYVRRYSAGARARSSAPAKRADRVRRAARVGAAVLDRARTSSRRLRRRETLALVEQQRRAAAAAARARGVLGYFRGSGHATRCACATADTHATGCSHRARPGGARAGPRRARARARLSNTRVFRLERPSTSRPRRRPLSSGTQAARASTSRASSRASPTSSSASRSTHRRARRVQGSSRARSSASARPAGSAGRRASSRRSPRAASPCCSPRR